MKVHVKEFSWQNLGGGKWKEISLGDRVDGKKVTVDYVFRRNGFTKYSLLYRSPQDGMVVLIFKNGHLASVFDEVFDGDRIDVGVLPARAHVKPEAVEAQNNSLIQGNSLLNPTGLDRFLSIPHGLPEKRRKQ